MHDFQIFHHNGEDHSHTKPDAGLPTTSLPKDPNPLPRLGEHTALHHLLQYKDVTIYSVQSGCWCDPQVWNLKRIPNQNDRVCVRASDNVFVDAMGGVALNCRNDGTLRFLPDQNSFLSLETLGNLGTLEIGTATAPIQADKSARITFRDTGPLDPVRDPLLQSRGLISYGEVSICGAEKTEFGKIQSVKAGASKVTLLTAPLGWHVGDVLVFPSTVASENQDETVTVTKVSGKTVYFEPALKFAHQVAVTAAPRFTRAGSKGTTVTYSDTTRKQFVAVANLSRNVTLESENAGDIRRRAHVMLMGVEPVQTCYVHFKNLGRTDKSRIIVDTPNDVGAQASNERARYAWHCHRMGIAPGTRPALALGCTASNSPGWGFVNHSSHALIRKCIAFNCTGAGFATEVGNEFGEFTGCLSIRNSGSGLPVGGEEDPQRSAIDDFGHMGFGFWFQGMGCKIEGNTAFGAAQAGFGITGTLHNRERTPSYNPGRFPVDNTPNPSIFDNQPPDNIVVGANNEIDRRELSFRFKNNTCAASRFGLESWRMAGEAPLYPGVTRNIENLTVWGCSDPPLFLNYSSHFTFVRCWLRGPGKWSDGPPSGWMMIGDDNAMYRTFLDCRIEEFKVGLQWFRGLKVVRGYLNNETNFLVLNIPYTLEVSETVFGPREGAVDFAVDRGRESGPDTIVLFNGKRLFYRAQAPAGSVEATKGARLRGLFAAR